MKPSRLSRRIVERVNAELDIPYRFDPDNTAIRSLRPAVWQRSVGAWRWELTGLDGMPHINNGFMVEVGSISKARDVAHAPRISMLLLGGCYELFAESSA